MWFGVCILVCYLTKLGLKVFLVDESKKETDDIHIYLVLSGHYIITDKKMTDIAA